MLALAPVAPKLAKLIPRLASNHDGEVVATVRAIERTLRSAGLDLHDLARHVEDRPEPAEEVEPETWADVARWCRDHDGGSLDPKARAFVVDLAARLVCGGEPTRKQADWLRAIYARLREREAA